MVGKAEILANFAGIVEEVTGTSGQDITEEKTLVDDLDIDSLSLVEIVVQLEDRFGMKIPEDELTSVKTVGDVVDYLAANC